MLQWLWGRGKLRADERRAAERRAVGHRLNDRLIVEVGSSGWPAYLEDISTTGAGLIVGMRQEPGSVVPLRLLHMRRREEFMVQAQVVHTERRADGHWFSGCVFQEALAAEDLEQLL